MYWGKYYKKKSTIKVKVLMRCFEPKTMMIYKLNVQHKVKHYPNKEGVIATLSFTNKENNKNIFIFCECYCENINSQIFGTLKEFKFFNGELFLIFIHNDCKGKNISN